MAQNELLDAMFGKINVKEYLQGEAKCETISSDDLIKLCHSEESRLRFAAYSELKKQNIVLQNLNPNEIFGFVMEVGVDSGKVDRIAAYTDGSARYFGFDGTMIMWDQRVSTVEQTISILIENAKTVFSDISLWRDSYFEDLKKGNIRFNVLTPNGYKIIEGEFGLVAKIDRFQGLLKPAMQLIQLLKSFS